MWKRFDDSVVREIQEEEVGKEVGDRQAYILFYERV